MLIPRQSGEENPPIALKKLSANSTQKEFSREQLALQRLQELRHNHLIQLVSSFQQSSYCFLFPWAGGGDLKSFWQGKWSTERRTPELVAWALGQMERISDAVDLIHTLPVETISEENGRHGDLKPQNILLFDENSNENNPGILRITDVGLARFHAQCTSLRKEGTTTRGETIEYAPPEALDEGPDVKRSRKFDIWSLGCIYLEFITWVVGGYDSVEEFRKARKTPSCRNHEFYESRTKGHSEVKNHIKRLRGGKRCKKGTSFGDLLDVIEKHLLVIEYRKRWNSTQLKTKLASILEKARGQGDYLCDPDGFLPTPVQERPLERFLAALTP